MGLSGGHWLCLKENHLDEGAVLKAEEGFQISPVAGARI